MNQSINFKIWLLVGILAEICIVLFSYLTYIELPEVFRYAARYSGRLSLLAFLIAFYLFIVPERSQEDAFWSNLKKVLIIFSVLHFIHFIFLVINVRLNNIELIPFKLAGGFLAYLLIIIYPWLIDHLRTRTGIHLFYFYYVGLVMILTLIARIKGAFEGASPSVIHYVSLTFLFLAFLASVFYPFLRRRKIKNKDF